MKQFDQIIGYEDIKRELYRICDTMKNPEKYKKLGVTTPRGLLLCGEPGIGKTMMAMAFIEESGRKSYTIRKNKSDGDFVDVITETFEEAKKNAPSIVLLDDMDKFANEDVLHRDAEEYVTVQSCIDDCKNFEVFVIATVNNERHLPDSLRRAGRFDTQIELYKPRRGDEVKIVDYFLKQKKLVGKVDAREIARLLSGRTCAELEKVINEAGIYAGYAGKDFIEHEDIVKACKRLIFDAPECEDETGIKVSRAVAVHEAGHAVVMEILDPGTVSLVSVSVHAGESRGITSRRMSDDYEVTKEFLEHEVIGLLAGKAAAEVVLGIVDTGCNDDLERAYQNVTELAEDLCAYGFDTHTAHNSSQHLLETRDCLVAHEMNRYYQEAKRLIAENREMVNRFTEELLARKTLTWNDIRKIKESMKKEK